MTPALFCNECAANDCPRHMGWDAPREERIAHLIEKERLERAVKFAEQTLQVVTRQNNGNKQAKPVVFWAEQVRRSRHALRAFADPLQSRLPWEAMNK